MHAFIVRLSSLYIQTYWICMISLFVCHPTIQTYWICMHSLFVCHPSIYKRTEYAWFHCSFVIPLYKRTEYACIHCSFVIPLYKRTEYAWFHYAYHCVLLVVIRSFSFWAEYIWPKITFRSILTLTIPGGPKKTEQSIQSIFQDFALINSHLFSPCWIEHLFLIKITPRSSNLVENFSFYE